MKHKPKLLIYSSYWHEKRDLLFCRYLSEYFEVVVITSLSSNEKILKIIEPVKVITVKFWVRKKIGLSFSLKFKKYIKKFRPSYVLTFETHAVSAYQSAKLASEFNFKAIVFSWQNVDTIPKYFFQSYIQKRVIDRSSYFLAGTLDTKGYLEKKGANPNSIYINPETGFDRENFKGDGNLRDIWGFNKEDFIVMYAGRLIREKGIYTIFEVAKDLEKLNNNIKFVFIGKGDLTAKIQHYSKRNVFYKGFYDFLEMGKALKTCDIFIYPSISTKYWVEQFGYSVVEAQACGRPTIVTNSGCLPKFVDDGINGSIIEERNVLELKTKILWWHNRLKENKQIDNSFTAKFCAENIALNYKRILIDNDPSLLNNWF